jgi:hypothetical protein
MADQRGEVEYVAGTDVGRHGRLVKARLLLLNAVLNLHMVYRIFALRSGSSGLVCYLVPWLIQQGSEWSVE